MARKKDTPQKAALREMMGNYLKENNVTAVSYTHLDVYKRQVIGRGCPKQPQVSHLC